MSLPEGLRFLAVVLALAGAGANAAPTMNPCSGAGPALPARAATAPGGAEFARRVAALSGLDRDRAIVREVLDGNVPAHLRQALPVVLGATRPGQSPRITICVLPDYLAVGTDADSLLVPLGLGAAMDVAEGLGFSLPTRRIVDAIYRQASVRLEPSPLPASDEMRSTAYVQRHNAMVLAQRELVQAPAFALVAGQKKDLVLTNLLWTHPGRVAIYGWHRPDGSAIQPLSIVHGSRYADYSHGVRLVSDVAYVDGRPVALASLLRDPAASPALSDEGTIAPPPDWRATLAADASDRTHSLR